MDFHFRLNSENIKDNIFKKHWKTLFLGHYGPIFHIFGATGIVAGMEFTQDISILDFHFGPNSGKYSWYDILKILKTPILGLFSQFFGSVTHKFTLVSYNYQVSEKSS